MADEDDEDEDRRARVERTLREARETLRRTQRTKEVERGKREIEDSPPGDVAHTLIPAPLSQNERWRLEAKAAEAAREAAKAEIASASRAQPLDWSALDARVRATVEAECMYLVKSCGAALGEILTREREETAARIGDAVHELKIEIAKLGSEVTELRAQLAVERSRAVGVDPPARRVN
jgi:hypothetical protein